MRLLIFGPPGAGKGTQARLLQEEHELTHISTGGLFRKEIKEGTPFGRSVQAYMAEGRLVPDEMAWKLTREVLAEIDCDQFILDGYPRTVDQAQLLETFLKERRKPIEALISLEVAPDVIVQRLSRRRMDRATGRIYHLDFNPPPAELPPDQLVHREDDFPAAIRHRITVYQKQTAPVKAFYEERGLLHGINGEGEIAAVQARINETISTVSANTR